MADPESVSTSISRSSPGADRSSLRCVGYTAERYLEKIARARASIDDLAITTDVIVGFPGETERDFGNPRSRRGGGFRHRCYTFIFSPRPGTRAASMTDDFVPEEVIAERLERLVESRETIRRSSATGPIGRVEEIVVEGISKRDSSIARSRTRQGKVVNFAYGDRVPPGRYLRACPDQRSWCTPSQRRSRELWRGASEPAPVRLRVGFPSRLAELSAEELGFRPRAGTIVVSETSSPTLYMSCSPCIGTKWTDIVIEDAVQALNTRVPRRCPEELSKTHRWWRQR